MKRFEKTRKGRAFAALFLALLLLLPQFLYITAEQSHATTAPPEIVGAGGFMIDAASGEVLYTKASDERFEPASTTKMITCILALENLPLDRIVTIDAETPFTEGSRIYLEEGEQLSVEELLYGLMLESANDCAVALAKEISGSVEEFAKLMNQRAAELGATNTNFVNPNGLHEDGHYSTAHDLAMIAKYGMTLPMFRTLVSTYQHTIPQTNEQETRYLYNTNRLLYDTTHKVLVNGVQRECKYDGVTGVKTGYTSHAGGCLVASALRDGTELIAVTLSSTDMDRFADCIALLDWGFENYYTVRLPISKEGLDIADRLKVNRGAVKDVGVELGASEFVTTLPTEASEYVLTTDVRLSNSVDAPVEAGQELGKVEILETGEVIGEIPIFAAEAVEKGGFLSIFGIEDAKAKKIYIAAGCVLGLILIFFVTVAVLRARNRRRRRALRAKKAMEIAKRRAEEENKRSARDWPY